MGRPRSRSIKHDAELGLSLYAPTATTHRYRLDYTDPFTAKRCQPRRVDQGDAFALWDETLEYLQTARHAMPLSSKDRKSNVPTVNDLFQKRVERWLDESCSEHYINNRTGQYYYRLAPVFGDMTVREWAASGEGCREVLRSARVQGLAPTTVEGLGTLMRSLVTIGWELRWIPLGHNPMLGVKYTAGATEQGQQAEFVREEDRPEFSAVEKLILAYDDLAISTDIPWLAERALVGAHGGLRPGERDALRIRDLRPDKLTVVVDEAFTWPRGANGPRCKAPKNNKRRQVLLPASTMDRLVRLAEQRQATGAASDALLFEDPCRPGLPLSESKTSRLHTAAALMAGWETVEVRSALPSQSGLVPERRPRHTNYSLRHHAAVWMHEVAGFDWTDVSRALGHHSVAFTFAVYVRSGADADERNRGRLLSL